MSLSLEEVLAALPKRLQKVFEDSSVTELMINSPSSVWFEKDGCLYPVYTDKTPKTEALTERMLDTFVKRIARPLGFDADNKSPIVDARLPDGSRVAIACPPITASFALSIRRFGSRPWTAAKLVETGSIPSVVLTLIAEALSQRENIIISGGTGTGKTTMLSAFASLIDEEERIVCIEDTRELHIPAPNCLRLEAKSSADGEEGSSITIRNLVRHALRHRPDRLIVGEVRGEEAQDLIEALNTGHGGSISDRPRELGTSGPHPPRNLRSTVEFSSTVGRNLRTRRPGGSIRDPPSALERRPPRGASGSQGQQLRPQPAGLRLLYCLGSTPDRRQWQRTCRRRPHHQPRLEPHHPSLLRLLHRASILR